jgi:hypothetical protein
MTDDKQEGQKTVVSFIVGLLIGGLLVWAFSGPAVDAPSDKDGDKDTKEMVEGENETSEEENTNTTGEMESEGKSSDTPVATLPVGDGKVSVSDQAAGNFIELSSATYPISEGWIGVRDYDGKRLGGLLGVARFSEEQGLVPNGVPLQRPTDAGKTYAVVVYSESGDRLFSLANDIQIDSVFATFRAE